MQAADSIDPPGASAAPGMSEREATLLYENLRLREEREALQLQVTRLTIRAEQDARDQRTGRELKLLQAQRIRDLEQQLLARPAPDPPAPMYAIRVPRRRRARLTAEEVSQLKTALWKGEHYLAVAARFNLSVGYINQFRRRHRITKEDKQ